MADFGITEGIALAGLALTAASTYVSYQASEQQASDSKAAGEYNAEVQRNNAQAQQQQAEFEAQQTRDKYRRVVGSQIAQYAQSGVSIDGSASDVISDTLLNGELDALSSEYKGKLAYNRGQTDAQLSLMEGSNASSRAESAGSASLINGLSSGVSQGARLYDPPRSTTPASIKAQPVGEAELGNPKFYNY